jgi:hypothetical protein
MECIKCKVHICWNCMIYFDTASECYNHLQICLIENIIEMDDIHDIIDIPAIPNMHDIVDIPDNHDIDDYI